MIHCKTCGGPITFKRLANGRWCPTEVDGSDHFDRCSRLQFERVQREGEFFSNKQAAGYALDDTVKFTYRRGQTIVGKHYHPVDCPHGPPWERCTCSTLINGLPPQ